MPPPFGGDHPPPAELPAPPPPAIHAAVARAPQDLERPRRIAGLILAIAGCTLGIVLNMIVFVLPALASGELSGQVGVFLRSAAVAYIPVALYLLVPYLVDRYDPEPWWALAGVFAWGACFASGVSALVFGMVADAFSFDVAVAVSAPIVEEITKGMAIFGMAVFLRREFDGVVDGIIYGTFVGIGFAATENIVYYVRYAKELEEVFYLRGVLTPWCHPLFSALVGIGFGLARENEHAGPLAKIGYPLAGGVAGITLHLAWNGLPYVIGDAFAINLAVGTVMALCFLVMIGVLVHRKGQTIRKYLEDEVLIGTISQDEFDLITAYGGRLLARLSQGKTGADFVRAGARLALCKWHTARAMKGQTQTLSADFIVPLRNELAKLRDKMVNRK